MSPLLTVTPTDYLSYQPRDFFRCAAALFIPRSRRLSPVSQDASVQGQSPSPLLSSPLQQRLILPTVFVPFFAVDALEKESVESLSADTFPVPSQRAQLPRVPRERDILVRESPKQVQGERQPVIDDTGRPIFRVVQTAIQLGQFRYGNLSNPPPILPVRATGWGSRSRPFRVGKPIEIIRKPKRRKAQFFTFLLRRRLFNEMPYAATSSVKRATAVMASSLEHRFILRCEMKDGLWLGLGFI
ncbi:hypothetical protein CSAL01_13061 [Colletotrichum salicis]|uniref:Uncharacterized protein n=1 Tax=Colletotrichum salicis TaxID=1209931 RepID=A0A135V8V4_9PEZI|nr:hypothetical protein CSAL01_13061 [Colletotrichum salicis]